MREPDLPADAEFRKRPALLLAEGLATGYLSQAKVIPLLDDYQLTSKQTRFIAMDILKGVTIGP